MKNRLKAIRTLGDVITEIDVARGAAPEPRVRLRLDEARAVLNHRVIQLVNLTDVDEPSDHFQQGLGTLELCKSRMAGSGQDVLKNLDDLVGGSRLLISSLPGNNPTDDPGPRRKKP